MMGALMLNNRMERIMSDKYCQMWWGTCNLDEENSDRHP